MVKKFRVGLVLGGGGARGLAHIGILRVLHREGLIPDYIVGTSIGALIGYWYAATLSPEKAEESLRFFLSRKEFLAMQEILDNDHAVQGRFPKFNRFMNNVRHFFIMNVGFIRNSIVPEDSLQRLMEETVPHDDFSELKIPFACVATDLTHGKKVVFEEGNLRKAILASISIPGVFPPVRDGDSYLCDGASVGYTPVLVAKNKDIDFIVATEVKGFLPPVSFFQKGLDVILRAQDVGTDLFHREELKAADFVFHPSVKHVYWSNFRKIDFCIRKGEEEAQCGVQELKKLIQKKKLGSFYKRLLN